MSDRFTKLDDGWYRDSKTGLEWSQTALERMNHADAIVWCESVGGRLPTIKELIGIVDYEMHYPCTELPDTQSFIYWSASTYAPNPFSAWIVFFFDGCVFSDGKAGNGYVRAVRSGS